MQWMQLCIEILYLGKVHGVDKDSWATGPWRGLRGQRDGITPLKKGAI